MFEFICRGLLVTVLSVVFVARADAAVDQASTPALVDGITNFLMSRVQANAAYMFQEELKEHSQLGCYLPNTYGPLVDSTNFLQLIKTSSRVWKSRLASDFELNATVYLLSGISFPIQDSEIKNLAQFARNIIAAQILDQYKKSGNLVTDAGALDQLQQVQIKDLQDDLATIAMKIAKVKKYQANYCVLSKLSNPVLSSDYNNISGFLNSFSTHMADPPGGLGKISDEKYLVLYDSLVPILLAIKDGNYTAAANELSVTFGQLINEQENQENKERIDNEGKAIQTYYNPQIASARESTKYILFFAALADAKTADQVETILDNFLLPPVSYGEIREKTHTSISAFVGLFDGDFGKNGKQNAGQQQKYGVFAPIGIERSWTCPPSSNFELGSLFRDFPESWLPCSIGSSLGIMVSPFDFGYPISLKMNNSPNAISWGDVVNPSILFSYGLKGSPFNWGVALQRVNKSLNVPTSGTRTILFFSMDMPLYILR